MLQHAVVYSRLAQTPLSAYRCSGRACRATAPPKGCYSNFVSMVASSKYSRFTPELKDYVRDLLKKAKRGEQVVHCWEKIMDELVKHKLVYPMQLIPDLVGIHPLNRSKFGICPRAMNGHGSKIHRQGFSWKKASDATAVEPPADKVEFDNAVEDNRKWAELSNGLLPELADLKALSIGGANTNGFLRAARAKCPCLAPSCAKDGCWDTERMAQQDDNFNEAYSKGLKWNVIDRECVEVWGEDFIHVGQSALNAKASTELSENEVMLGMALAAIGNNPDWAQVKAGAIRNNPPCEGYIDECATFARENGGAGADTLLDIADYLKAVLGDQSYASRSVGGSFLKCINGVSKKTKQVPYVKCFAYTAQLVCPTHLVEGGSCSMLTKKDIQKLQAPKNEINVFLAEQMISDSKGLLQQTSLTRAHQVRIRGTFGIRLVLHICGRGADSVDQCDFEDFGEIVTASPTLV